MTVIDTIRPLVAAETAKLAPTLYESVSLAIDGARTRMAGIDLSMYPAQFSGLVRVEVREDLVLRELPQGWSVAGDPRQMAQLVLINEEQDLLFRFLKENRANRGGVPHAGHNRARREVWSERPTQLALDFGSIGTLQSDRPLDSDPMTFLLLWSPIDPADLDAGFTLRVVHTVEPGTHRQGVVCDMEIELLQGGEIHERLAFAGADEAGDLFEIAIEKENDDQ
ncbi:hypothetical protein SEA_OPIE_34 [Gordonia phage Opie]|nr:hypothetical protein SEA_OPIE_34 [Gordonia phage Opie]